MVGLGKIDPELAAFAIRDYINPSLDTTISAIGHLVYHLGTSPGMWEKLKSDPSLAVNAVHEAVRIGTPIRSFSRHTARPVSSRMSAKLPGLVMDSPGRVDIVKTSSRQRDRRYAKV